MPMAMEEADPPLSTITSPSSSDAAGSTASSPAILTRLIAAFALLVVALWANYEASRSVDISVVASPGAASPAGRRFNLNFVSNGRAHRIVYRASHLVEQVLYPEAELFPRKPVDRITLRLAGVDLPSSTSLTQSAAVDGGGGAYTIHLSPVLMSAATAEEVDAVVSAAVQRAVARVWLWDGQREAPEPLLEAIAEYIAAAAGYMPLSSNAPCGGAYSESSGRCWSAEFLRYCETQGRRGFVARLNRGMRQRWSEFTADEALGSPVRRAYAAYTAAEAEAGRVVEYFNMNSTTSAAATQAM